MMVAWLLLAAAALLMIPGPAPLVLSFVAAKRFTRGRRAPIRRIVIHSAESARAVWVAGDFALGLAPPRSAHYVVDANQVIQCVSDADTAWAAPGANEDGIQIELCGFARWSAAEWRSSGILSRCAPLLRQLSAAHAIPLVFLDAAALPTDARGVTTHAAVTKAFGLSSHIDPGVDFPMSELLALAKAGQ